MTLVTTIPISIEHVWNDDGTAIKGASITEASFVDGVFWKKEVKHLADSTLEGVRDFQTAFNASIVKERDELKTSLETKTAEFDTASQQLQSVTTEKDDLVVSTTKRYDDLVTATTAEKESLIASHTTEKTTLIASTTKAREDLIASHTSEKASLTTQISTITTDRDAKSQTVSDLTAKVAKLTAEVPYPLRTLSSKAFVKRLNVEEALDLKSSKDPTVIAIANTFDEYRKNEWRIELDSDEFAQPMAYLVAVGMISEDRVKEISRDSTREEAYKVPDISP